MTKTLKGVYYSQFSLVLFRQNSNPHPGVKLGDEDTGDKTMTNLMNLIATATQALADSGLMAEIAKWKEMFLANFGSQREEEFKMGDEAFYNLLTRNQHSTIAEKMVESPTLFCRAKILGAFFQGKSSEKVDGKNVERNYPKATGPAAIKAAEAVSPVLVSALTEVMSRHADGVGFKFWITDPKHSNYDADICGGKDAQLASSLMHCLLNITDGLGDVETTKALREWFRAGFNNIPSGVYNRVKDESLGIVNNLVGNDSQPVQRQGAIPDSKYTKTNGGGDKPEKTLKGPGPKKSRTKRAPAEVNPMAAMKPTAEDERLLAEYRAANNGNQPSNTAMAALASANS